MADETGAWMPMYWADYFGDTMHLSTEEHGAYLLLIGTYWRRGKALPDDDKWLATVTKMTTKKWKMVRPKVSEFFDISDGQLYHKRIEKEILKSSGRLQSARAAGKAGGLAKSKLPTTTPTKKKDPVANATDADGVAEAGSKEHDRLLFRLARKAGRPSAPTEFRKLGMEDLRIEMLIREAIGRAEPRAYLAGILTKQQARDGPKHWNEMGTETGMSPTLERMIRDEQRNEDRDSDAGTALLAAGAETDQRH